MCKKYMNKLFKNTVIGFLILLIIWYCIPFFWEHLYNDEQLNLLSWHGYESFIDIYGPIPYIIAFLYIVASLGLLSYKKWGRTMLLSLTIVTIFPIWGYGVTPPIEGSIGYIVTLAQGVILTISYFTSINNEFN